MPPYFYILTVFVVSVFSVKVEPCWTMEENHNSSVIIFDVNPVWWAIHNSRHDQTDTFQQCVENLMVFCNSYLMVNHNNKLAFIACHTNTCQFLYPPKEDDGKEHDTNIVRDGKFEVFGTMNNIITKRLAELVNTDCELQQQSPTLLAGALTKALCYLHNQEKNKVGCSNCRILIIKGSPDVSGQYMPIMNCIFAAQKKNIMIDSCALVNSSGFLQQAADITNGIYFKVEQICGLLEYLLWIYLPDANLREKLTLPSIVQIDYRAACFCHKQLVDIGFVCSVCLSIYCQFMPKCLTCQTRFKLPSFPPKSKPKRKKKEV